MKTRKFWSIYLEIKNQLEFIIIDPFAEEPSGLANLFQHLNFYLGIPLLLRKHRNFTIGDIVTEGEKVIF